MLERTAASLESCNLQRVLSQPARSAKRHRQLCQGFWQHGASAIELGSAWSSSSSRALAAQSGDATAAQPQASLNASAFFLDFLYPNTTLASLQRTYPNLSRASYKARSSAASRRRHFASSQCDAAEKPGEPEQEPGLNPPVKEKKPSLEELMRSSRKFDSVVSKKKKKAKAAGDDLEADPNDALAAIESENSVRSSNKPKPPVEESRFSLLERTMQKGRKHEPKPGETAKGLDDSLPVGNKPKSKREIELEAYAAATALLVNRPKLNPRDLPGVLAGPERDRYLDVWDMYSENDKDQQASYRIQVLSYLSKSTGIVEVERCMSLISRVLMEEWNEEFQAAAILTYFRQGGLSAAVDQFTKGLEAKGIAGGFEHILSEAIIQQQWSTVFTVWMAYYKTCLDFRGVRDVDLTRLDMLSTVPDLGNVCIKFEKWIANNNGPGGLAAGAPSNRGLHMFRRKLAEKALEQPCPPRHADVILESLRKSMLYHKYILRMIGRWTENLETRSSLVMLPDIFQKYQRRKDYNPSREMLHAMFDLYFPRNATGLEDIFQDWHKFFGGLDKSGYRKFLKHYARAGDVDAVQALWKRYAKKFPSEVTRPVGFRSTMNVYAQIGDVAQAQKEMERMTREFGVKPDIDTWNTLLKCCVRADDYDMVLKCFEDICERHKPDHFTYAHVMAMASKRGDVARTLEFFTRSQNEGVRPSKQMVLPLVTAYCRNDMLHEAQSICVELAQRGITSTDSWTELIRCYGKQSKLDKCHEILQTMRKFGIEWDADTYEALFKAMVIQGQISDAADLLQRAFKERLFVVDSQHFATIIDGAVRRGDLTRARSIRLQMAKKGVPMTFNAQVAIAWGVYKTSRHKVNPRKLAMDIVDSLRSVVSHPAASDNTGADRSRVSVATSAWNMRDIRNQTSSIGMAIELLAELKEFGAIEDLVNVYFTIVPSRRENYDFPQFVNAALMKAYLVEGSYDKVQQMWNNNWEKVLVTAQRPDGSGIYPAREYVLAPPMNVMVRMFLEKGDPTGLKECVKMVTETGFKLSNACWNNIVLFLCELGDWDTAVDWCERLLMPNWRGWHGRPSTADIRRRENSRLLWPTPKVLYALMNHWLQMRKLQDWSPEISLQLRRVERELSILQSAFETADLGRVEIRLGLQLKPADPKAIDRTLMDLTEVELLVLRRWLYRQRYMLKQESWQDGDANSDIRTEVGAPKFDNDPLTPQMMQTLEPTLQAKMEEGADRDTLLEEARAKLSDRLTKEDVAFDVKGNALDAAARSKWIDIWEKRIGDIDHRTDAGEDNDRRW